MSITYNMLTPDERLSMLRPRIAEAERRHYQAVLNARSSPAGANDELIQAEEANLAWLKEEEQSLTGLVRAAEKSSKKS